MSLIKKIIAEAREVDEVGELVTLLRSSQLPTIVVEEPNDMRFYNRWIEQHLFNTYNVDVLAAGGKDNLLHLYKRRSEFAGVPIVFVANRGMWLFSEVPKDYADIVYSKGFSIENEIYSNGRIERLIQYNPTIEYDRVKEAGIKWFACEVDEYFETKIQRGTPNLDELISEGETELNKDFLEKRGFDHPPRDSTIKDIEDNYLFRFPGKLLFQMLKRFSGITFDGLYNTALVNYKAEQHGIIGEIRRHLGQQRLISSQKILTKSEEQKPPEKDQNLFLPENESISKSESLVGRLVRKEIIDKGDTADILKELMKQNKMKFSPITTMTSRDDLLSIYSNRQLSIYVVDREMRVFRETPESYLNVIWTKGYSLENDLYIDGGLENLIDPHEKWKHRQVLNATIKWFAFEVEKFFDNETLEMDVKLSDIVLPGQLELNKKFCEENNFREPPAERIQHIIDDYPRLLPGKYLFQILVRFLNTPGRSFNYKASLQSLSDIALAANSTQQPLDELARQIRAKLDSIKDQIDSAKISTAIQSPKNDSRTEIHFISTDKPKIKVGDKIKAKILTKDGIKITVQLLTDNNEEITFERPYYPGQVGSETKLRVIAVDSTGRVKKVTP